MYGIKRIWCVTPQQEYTSKHVASALQHASVCKPKLRVVCIARPMFWIPGASQTIEYLTPLKILLHKLNIIMIEKKSYLFTLDLNNCSM